MVEKTADWTQSTELVRVVSTLPTAAHVAFLDLQKMELAVSLEILPPDILIIVLCPSVVFSSVPIHLHLLSRYHSLSHYLFISLYITSYLTILLSLLTSLTLPLFLIILSPHLYLY